ncbi:MAG: L,D-transpeptidase family protein [Lachnospiraceae bacterium]|nr:L,D-transpeptidase family protein [Lachnospiraceae bacterium]
MLGKITNKLYKKLGIMVAAIMLLTVIYIPEINSYATELATSTNGQLEELSTGTDASVVGPTTVTDSNVDTVSEEVTTTEVTTVDENLEDENNIYDANSLIYQADETVARPIVNYAVHAQSFGWMAPVKDGQRAGSIGKSKRVEAIAISLDTNGILGDDGAPITGGIKLRAHVQGIGWQDWVYAEADGASVTMNIQNNSYAGTMGKAKRIEAIEIALTGELEEKYDVLYRVHGQSYGWQSAKSNGATAGTVGKAKRIEALEIIIVEKDAQVSASITYSVHSQSYGWMNPITITPGYGNSSTIAGTVGKSKRLEAMKIDLKTTGITGGIEYKAHIQGIGWQNPVTGGELAGTEGAAKRMEAITIELTGQVASYYDIYYRVHVQSLGWLGWAKNGQKAGTEGARRRIEAIQIYLVESGEAAPGSTSNPYYNYTGNGWKNAPGQLTIKVNKQMNCITIYKGKVPFKAMVCSTGYATPVGSFNLKQKWRWKELIHDVYGQYSYHITGNYLFHSVPYDDPNIYKLFPSDYNKLGQTASAGCIRLTTIDAKWLYDNCPTGTPVIIYNSPDPGPLGKPTAQKIPANQTWDPTDPLINK